MSKNTYNDFKPPKLKQFHFSNTKIYTPPEKMSQLRKPVPVKLYDFQPDTWEEMNPPPGETNKPKPNLKPTSTPVQYKPRSETVTSEMKKNAKNPKGIPEDGEWRSDLDDALIVSSETHRPNFQAFKKQYNESGPQNAKPKKAGASEKRHRN